MLEMTVLNMASFRNSLLGFLDEIEWCLLNYRIQVPPEKKSVGADIENREAILKAIPFLSIDLDNYNRGNLTYFF